MPFGRVWGVRAEFQARHASAGVCPRAACPSVCVGRARKPRAACVFVGRDHPRLEFMEKTLWRLLEQTHAPTVGAHRPTEHAACAPPCARMRHGHGRARRMAMRLRGACAQGAARAMRLRGACAQVAARAMRLRGACAQGAARAASPCVCVGRARMGPRAPQAHASAWGVRAWGRAQGAHDRGSWRCLVPTRCARRTPIVPTQRPPCTPHAHLRPQCPLNTQK